MDYLQDLTKKYIDAIGDDFNLDSVVKNLYAASEIKAAEKLAKNGDLDSSFTEENVEIFIRELETDDHSEEFYYERDSIFSDLLAKFIVSIYPSLTPEQQEAVRKLVDEDSNIDTTQLPQSNQG
jgi:hypothetical protein